MLYMMGNSRKLPVMCCVPHGSILGHLLLIIYMNDICNVSEMQCLGSCSGDI